MSLSLDKSTSLSIMNFPISIEKIVHIVITLSQSQNFNFDTKNLMKLFFLYYDI